MKIHFYLDSKKNKLDERAIYCIIRGIEKGKTIYLNTGFQINPKHWNTTQENVRKTFNDYSDFNYQLTELKSKVTKALNKINLNTRKIPFELLKQELIETLDEKEQQVFSFFDIYNKFLELNKNALSKTRIRRYNVLKNHLTEFCAIENFSLTFDAIDYSFETKFKDFLYLQKKQVTNTVSAYVKLLKTYLNWATINKYNSNLTYKNFKILTEEVDIIYLTEVELLKLFNKDLSKNTKLAQVRDVFCFACFTGQRFSDVHNIEWSDIKDGYWYLRTQKTRDNNQIPFNDFMYEIINKYEENKRPLPVISLQKTNEYLKELGKEAEINTPVTITKFQGNTKIEFTKPKYEFMSTHIGRRTFCTLSLEKGMRPEMVMSITGHKSYASFKKYIKITIGVKKNEMNAIWSKKSNVDEDSVQTEIAKRK